MRICKIFSVVLLVLGFFAVTGCGSSSKGDSEYGYYTREDGTRIWYKK